METAVSPDESSFLDSARFSHLFSEEVDRRNHFPQVTSKLHKYLWLLQFRLLGRGQRDSRLLLESLTAPYRLAPEMAPSVRNLIREAAGDTCSKSLHSHFSDSPGHHRSRSTHVTSAAPAHCLSSRPRETSHSGKGFGSPPRRRLDRHPMVSPPVQRTRNRVSDECVDGRSEVRTVTASLGGLGFSGKRTLPGSRLFGFLPDLPMTFLA